MFALLTLLLMIGGVAADQASFVSNSGNMTGLHDPLHFNSVHVNRGGGLDQDTGRLHIQSWGLFLVTLSAGHPGAGASTNYSLHKDGSVMTSVYLGPSSSATDNTIGHDIVSFFYQDEELHIRSNSSNLYSTLSGQLTSWGTVSLSQAMGVGVGFGVCRTSTNVAGKLSFDRIWANVGNSWDTANNQFVAPLSGIYFFSFSIGAHSNGAAELRLIVNGEETLNVYHERQSPYSNEIVGRSVLIQLLENDLVHVSSIYTGYSDLGCLTTFSGFLYSSVRSEQLAWAVYRSTSVYGTADPVTYPNVIVNEGAVWYNNQAHCFLTGLYYVSICTGIHSNRRVQLAIMKGSEVQGELLRVASTNPYGDTICRSMIIQCNAQETLRVTVPSSSGLWQGYQGNLISFIGFYLFP